jgi:hypothetical protein
MVNIYTAVIVEPRKHNALKFVLENFLDNLSNEWNIIIYHGNLNETFTRKIVDENLLKYTDRIKLINLNLDNLSIPDYNNLMVSKEFIESIPTEVFLIFQTDTLICESFKDLINDFIKYDYVGAPWTDGNIGNGGLSLRRKSKMIEIINKCPYDRVGTHNEDVYFSTGCNGIIINKPDLNKAKSFSMETLYNEYSFGLHKAWIYNLESQCDGCVIEDQCKGYDELKKLNSSLQLEMYNNVINIINNINTVKNKKLYIYLLVTLGMLYYIV